MTPSWRVHDTTCLPKACGLGVTLMLTRFMGYNEQGSGLCPRVGEHSDMQKTVYSNEGIQKLNCSPVGKCFTTSPLEGGPLHLGLPVSGV